MSSPLNNQGFPVGSITFSPINSLTGLGNFLRCDGSSVSAVIYPALFSVIGTTYGSSGAGFFNLPNLSNLFPRGVGSSALNTTGGSLSAILDQNTMPSHNHQINDPGHTHQQANFHSHDITACSSRSFFGASGSTSWRGDQESPSTTGEGFMNISQSGVNVSLQQTGGGEGFGFQNPFLSLIYIIAV